MVDGKLWGYLIVLLSTSLKWKHTKQNHGLNQCESKAGRIGRLRPDIHREVTGGLQSWSHKRTYSPLLSSSCICSTVLAMLQVYKCNQRLNSKSWATRSCRGALRHN